MDLLGDAVSDVATLNGHVDDLPVGRYSFSLSKRYLDLVILQTSAPLFEKLSQKWSHSVDVSIQDLRNNSASSAAKVSLNRD